MDGTTALSAVRDKIGAVFVSQLSEEKEIANGVKPANGINGCHPIEDGPGFGLLRHHLRAGSFMPVLAGVDPVNTPSAVETFETCVNTWIMTSVQDFCSLSPMTALRAARSAFVPFVIGLSCTSCRHH